MPIKIDTDKETGLTYCQLGDHGKKYFFNSMSVKSLLSALRLAATDNQ